MDQLFQGIYSKRRGKVGSRIQLGGGDEDYFLSQVKFGGGAKKVSLKGINQLLCMVLVKMLENYRPESDVISYQVHIMSDSETEERQKKSETL